MPPGRPPQGGECGCPQRRALTDFDCIVGFILGLGPRIFPMLLRFCREREHLELEGLSSSIFPVPSTEKTPLLSCYGEERAPLWGSP